VAYEIFKEMRKLGRSQDHQRIVVGANPAVTDVLQDQERQGLEEFERASSCKIIVTPDATLHIEQFDIATL
jgi:Ribonuclease G/E